MYVRVRANRLGNSDLVPDYKHLGSDMTLTRHYQPYLIVLISALQMDMTKIEVNSKYGITDLTKILDKKELFSTNMITQ